MDPAATVHRARTAAGLSQHALAKLSGVPQPTVSALETRRRGASIATLDTILSATGSRLVALPTTAARAVVRRPAAIGAEVRGKGDAAGVRRAQCVPLRAGARERMNVFDAAHFHSLRRARRGLGTEKPSAASPA